MDYDKTKMPSAYDTGRAYDPATLAMWLSTIGSAAPDRVSCILDLGCGTGRYSSALADHFDANVIAVDPSQAMLMEARKKVGPRVRLERASAESLPLADESVDVVFLSMVFHHFVDRARAAHEIHRVLRVGGRVLMRAGTTDMIATYPYVPFFPSSAAILAKDLQAEVEIEEIFTNAGFIRTIHKLVESRVAANWREYVAKLGYRADSILVQLSDEEFAQGMAALHRHAATRPPDEPVIERVDFFGFECV